MDTIVDQCCFELIIVLSLTPAFDVFTFSVIADAQNITLIDTENNTCLQHQKATGISDWIL